VYFEREAVPIGSVNSYPNTVTEVFDVNAYGFKHNVVYNAVVVNVQILSHDYLLQELLYPWIRLYQFIGAFLTD
jgi:hypothetical protein